MLRGPTSFPSSLVGRFQPYRFIGFLRDRPVHFFDHGLPQVRGRTSGAERPSEPSFTETPLGMCSKSPDGRRRRRRRSRSRSGSPSPAKQLEFNDHQPGTSPRMKKNKTQQYNVQDPKVGAVPTDIKRQSKRKSSPRTPSIPSPAGESKVLSAMSQRLGMHPRPRGRGKKTP